MTTTKQLSNFGKTTVILSVLIPAAHAATLSEVPVYQHFADDCFGLQDPNGGAGDFVVHKDCENYNTELWERPYEADKFDPDSNDSTMLSNHGGEYYAYADITKAAIGWNDQYLFARITVVGGFKQQGGSKDFGEGLKGHYYVYFSDNGTGAGGYLLELSDGTSPKDEGPVFTSGFAKIYHDGNGDVGGQGIIDNTLEDSFEDGGNASDGYDADTDDGTNIYVRQMMLDDMSQPDTIEFAVELDKVPFNANYLDMLQFLRFGAAASNPSSEEALFANDEYLNDTDHGVEYDTVALAIPEPSVAMLSAVAALALFGRRRKN